MSNGLVGRDSSGKVLLMTEHYMLVININDYFI